MSNQQARENTAKETAKKARKDVKRLKRARRQAFETALAVDTHEVLISMAKARFGNIQWHSVFQIVAEVISDSPQARRRLAQKLANDPANHIYDGILDQAATLGSAVLARQIEKAEAAINQESQGNKT